MSDPQMPPDITPAIMAKCCGITWKKALGDLKSAGILEKRGSRWVARESQVMEKLPEHYDRIYACLVLGQGPAT